MLDLCCFVVDVVYCREISVLNFSTLVIPL
uniref:Uncharacterized protein n=1 Tax=Rhizophora mucronata TaxID=61149 RepID=A0A2P2N228_RHIMU